MITHQIRAVQGLLVHQRETQSQTSTSQHKKSPGEAPGLLLCSQLWH